MPAAYGAEFRQGAIDVARRGEASVTQIELLDQIRGMIRTDLANTILDYIVSLPQPLTSSVRTLIKPSRADHFFGQVKLSSNHRRTCGTHQASRLACAGVRVRRGPRQ